MTAAELALLASTFVASFVECVEALTIVLAMGLTRGWRAALTGTALALVALVAFTAAAGYALATWLPTAALQLVIGTLLLIFGLQWLRKAILRSSGRKALHDEGEEYAEQAAAGRAAEDRTLLGVDAFGLIVSRASSSRASKSCSSSSPSGSTPTTCPWPRSAVGQRPWSCSGSASCCTARSPRCRRTR